MKDIKIQDRVKVCGENGSYRVQKIEGRSIQGVRVFEDGTTGKTIKFDRLDVSENYARTESKDDGKMPAVLSRDSQRFEERMNRKQAKLDSEAEHEWRQEQRMEHMMLHGPTN